MPNAPRARGSGGLPNPARTTARGSPTSTSARPARSPPSGGRAAAEFAAEAERRRLMTQCHAPPRPTPL